MAQELMYKSYQTFSIPFAGYTAVVEKPDSMDVEKSTQDLLDEVIA